MIIRMCQRWISVFPLLLLSLVSLFSGIPAEASCGTTSCFLSIDSIQGLPQKEILKVNVTYNYVKPGQIDGTSGRVPGTANTTDRVLVIDGHREIRTINQVYALDLNLGVTENFAAQFTLPYIVRLHRHTIREGNPNQTEAKFTDNGIGDIRLIGKYNIFRSLLHSFALGIGVELPTGKYNQPINKPANRQPPGVQLGRGEVGVIGTFYQTYAILPNTLSQFTSGSYRHTFRNDNGYQFGDEYILNAGINYQSFDWLALNLQFNWRYAVHDNFNSSLSRFTPGGGKPMQIDPEIKNRRVPNSGLTILMLTPGFSVNLPASTSVYFNVQFPLVRDFNNNLGQNTSFIGGISHAFSVF